MASDTEEEDLDLEALRNAALATIKPKPIQPIQQVISQPSSKSGSPWQEFPASVDVVPEYAYQPPDPQPPPTASGHAGLYHQAPLRLAHHTAFPQHTLLPQTMLQQHHSAQHSQPLQQQPYRWQQQQHQQHQHVLYNGVHHMKQAVQFSERRNFPNRTRTFGDRSQPLLTRGHSRPVYVDRFHSAGGRGSSTDAVPGSGNVICLANPVPERQQRGQGLRNHGGDRLPAKVESSKESLPKLALPQDKYHSSSSQSDRDALTSQASEPEPAPKARDKFSRYKDSDSDDDDDDEDDDDGHSEVDDITAEIDKVLQDEDDLFGDKTAVTGEVKADNAVTELPVIQKENILVHEEEEEDLSEINKDSDTKGERSRSVSPVASEAESIDLDALAAEEPILMGDIGLGENGTSASPDAAVDAVTDLSDLVSLASAGDSLQDPLLAKASSNSDDSSKDQKEKTQSTTLKRSSSPISQAANGDKSTTSPTVVPFTSDSYSSVKKSLSPKKDIVKNSTASLAPHKSPSRDRSLSPKEDLADLLALSPRVSPSRGSPVLRSKSPSVQTFPDKRTSPYRYTPPKGYRSPQRSPLPKGYRSPYRRSPSLPRQYQNPVSPRRSPMRRRSRSPAYQRSRSPRRSRSPLRRRSRSPLRRRSGSPRRRSLSPYSRSRYEERRNPSLYQRRRSPVTRPSDERRGLHSGNNNDRHYSDRHSMVSHRDGNRNRGRTHRSSSLERKARPLSPKKDIPRNEEKAKKSEPVEPVMSQADLDKLTPEERAKFEARRKKFLGEVQIDPSKKVSLKSIKERKKRKKSVDSKSDTKKDDKQLNTLKSGKIKKQAVSKEVENKSASEDEKPSLQDIEDDSEDSDSGRTWREEGNTDRKKAFMPQTMVKEKTALLSLDQISVKGGVPLDARRRDGNFGRNQRRPDRRHEPVRRGRDTSLYASRQKNLQNFESEDSDENNGNSRLTSSIVAKQPFKPHKVEKLRIEVQVTPPMPVEKVKKKKKEKVDLSQIYSVPSKRKMESPELEHNDEAETEILSVPGKKPKKVKKAKKEKKEKEKKKKKPHKIVEGLTADRIVEDVTVANLDSSGGDDQIEVEEEEQPVISPPSRPSVLERLGKKVKVAESKGKEKKKKKKTKNVSEDEPEPMDEIDRRRLQMKEKNAAILRRHQEIEQDKKMYG